MAIVFVRIQGLGGGEERAVATANVTRLEALKIRWSLRRLGGSWLAAPPSFGRWRLWKVVDSTDLLDAEERRSRNIGK